MAIANLNTADNNAYLFAESDSVFDTATGTVAFWVNADSTGGSVHMQIFERCSTTIREGIYIWRNNTGGIVTAQTYDGSGAKCTLTSTTALNRDDTWMHVAFVFRTGSGETCRLYINGTQEDSDTNSGAWSFGASRVSWGREHTAASQIVFEGRWAETAWYDTEVSATDIAKLAQGFSPLLVQPVSLVEYWALLRPQTLEVEVPNIADMGRINGKHLYISAGGSPSDKHDAYPHPRIFTPTRPMGVKGSAVSTMRFRRTLSHLGTRVGARQLHGR